MSILLNGQYHLDMEYFFSLNKFYSASSNVLLLFYEHLSGRLNMLFRILRTYFSGKIFIRFDLCYYI